MLMQFDPRQPIDVLINWKILNDFQMIDSDGQLVLRPAIYGYQRADKKYKVFHTGMILT